MVCLTPTVQLLDAVDPLETAASWEASHPLQTICWMGHKDPHLSFPFQLRSDQLGSPTHSHHCPYGPESPKCWGRWTFPLSKFVGMVVGIVSMVVTVVESLMIQQDMASIFLFMKSKHTLWVLSKYFYLDMFCLWVLRYFCFCRIKKH